MADREREKLERQRRAAEKREKDDFRGKVRDAIKDIPGLNAAKVSNVANGNPANPGNSRGGPRRRGAPPKHKAEEDGWKKQEYKKKWGNKSQTRKNSSQHAKEKTTKTTKTTKKTKQSENAIVQRVLALLEKRLSSSQAK